MKINSLLETVLVIGMIVQVAAMVALAIYAPLWVSIPLILLMIAI